MNSSSDDNTFAPSNKEAEPKSNNAVKYKHTDTVAAFVVFFLGYLFIRSVYYYPPSFGMFIFAAALLTISLLYVRGNKYPISKCDLSLFFTIAAFSFLFILSSNETIKGLTLMFLIPAFAYWVFAVCKGRSGNSINDDFISELFKAVIVLPFSRFFAVFGASAAIFKGRKTTGKVFMIFGGLLLALIPTFAVTLLLIMADSTFGRLIELLTDNIKLTDRMAVNFICVIIGLPVAMYIFGILYANSARQKVADLKSTDTAAADLQKTGNGTKILRFAPAILMCAGVTPICIIYLLFFISQFSYFFSPFSGLLPDGVISYSSYARRGFFELCAVVVINLCAVIILDLFTKRDSKAAKRTVKGYIILLSLFTLMLITTAMAKMIMYISVYGLTPKRIYPSWFMVVLGVVFILVILKQIFPRFNIYRVLTISVVLLLAILCFSDIDAHIANYNISRYIDGTLDSVDFGVIYSLSDSAVKYVLPLTTDSNPKIKQEAIEYIDWRKAQLASDKGWADNILTFNISSRRAVRLLDTR